MLKTVLHAVPCVPIYLTPQDHAALEIAVPVTPCVPMKSARERYRDELKRRQFTNPHGDPHASRHSEALSADGHTRAKLSVYANQFKGVVSIFTRFDDDTWIEQAQVEGSGAREFEEFGYAIALSADGNTLVVGAPYGRTVWIFTRDDTIWTEEAKLTPIDAVGSSRFGWSIALSWDGNSLAIGGPHDNSLTGAVWIFTRYGNIWTEQSKLTPIDGVGSLRFGWSLASSWDGDRLSIGGSDDAKRTGTVWIVTRIGTIWIHESKLMGDIT